MRKTSWIWCVLFVVSAICVTAAQRGAEGAPKPESLVGTWSGTWDGAGSGGGFELTLEQAKDGPVTGKVSVTGEPAYKATLKSLSFDGNKMNGKYDFTPDDSAEVTLAATFEGNKATGTWSLAARGTDNSLASGTWTVTRKTTAQEKPNFAGRWVLTSPAENAGQEQTVTHDAATLTTAHASTGHGHQAVYRLDGKESRNVLTSHGSDTVTVSGASWNGNQLTITSDTTHPDGRKRQAKEIWSLDGNGRLVIEFTESGLSAAPTTAKLVYTKR